jgi:hypothetical protein
MHGDQDDEGCASAGCTPAFTPPEIWRFEQRQWEEKKRRLEANRARARQEKQLKQQQELRLAKQAEMEQAERESQEQRNSGSDSPGSGSGAGWWGNSGSDTHGSGSGAGRWGALDSSLPRTLSRSVSLSFSRSPNNSPRRGAAANEDHDSALDKTTIRWSSEASGEGVRSNRSSVDAGGGAAAAGGFMGSGDHTLPVHTLPPAPLEKFVFSEGVDVYAFAITMWFCMTKVTDPLHGQYAIVPYTNTHVIVPYTNTVTTGDPFHGVCNRMGHAPEGECTAKPVPRTVQAMQVLTSYIGHASPADFFLYRPCKS